MKKLMLIISMISLNGCEKYEIVYIDAPVKKYMYFISESEDQIEKIDIFYTNGDHTEIDCELAKTVQRIELKTDSLAVHVYSHTRYDRYTSEYVRRKFIENDTLVHGVIGIFQVRR